MQNAYKILFRKPEEKKSLDAILQKLGVSMWTELKWLMIEDLWTSF
jgi:hypothetical protein